MGYIKQSIIPKGTVHPQKMNIQSTFIYTHDSPQRTFFYVSVIFVHSMKVSGVQHCLDHNV